MRYRTLITWAVLAAMSWVGLDARGQALPPLRVSENKRFFVKPDGTPFFWLADTSWGLFTVNRADAELYLKDRVDKKFNVVQAVIGFWSGLDRINPDGHPMFTGGDSTKPNEAFFAHIDWVVEKANSMGVYVAIVPLWSRGYVTQQRSIFTDESIRAFGKFLGERYRQKGVVWILGGDWSPVGFEKPWRLMAAGIAEGEGADKHLKTYHPRAPESSSFWFHNDDWLDFNLLQTGHSVNNRNYELVDDDYDRHPIKPVIDGEPAYENIADRAAAGGRIVALDVRRMAYGAVFAGAAGHTYGAEDVYGMRGATWKEAMKLPGSGQMQHVRDLIESRPMLMRIPDQWIIVNDPMSLSERIQACRASDGSYAFIYSSSGRKVHIKMRHHGNDYITGDKVKAWWYDPRNGEAKLIEEFERKADNADDRGRDDITRQFTPPTSGVGNDWVLVLDDASKNYPAPGKKQQ